MTRFRRHFVGVVVTSWCVSTAFGQGGNGDQAAGPAVSVWGLRIPAVDVSATAAFYREYAGFKDDDRFAAVDRSVVLKNGDARLWIAPAKRVVDLGDAPQTYINLAVHDVQAAMARLRLSQASHVDDAQRVIAVGKAATIRDPSGNRFNLIEHDPPRVGESDPPSVFNIGVTVTDVEAAETFYCGRLGLPVFSRAYLPNTLPLERVGAAPLVIHGWAKGERPAVDAGQTVAVVLSGTRKDWTASIDAVGAAGAAPVIESTPFGPARTIRDPFGNALIVLEPSQNPAGATARTPDASAGLKSLAWMQGTWAATHGSDVVEEVWSAPSADSLMGMFRWTRGGKVWMFELMNVTVEGDRLVFRLRHFNRDFVPWEEKDAALVYPMSRMSSDEVVFENAERDAPRRFVYRRAGADELVIRLEGPDGAGKKPDEFRLKRAGH